MQLDNLTSASPVLDNFGVNFVGSQTTLVSPWWSRRRDIDLFIAAKQVDQIAAALAKFNMKMCAVPMEIVPKNPHIKIRREEAKVLNELFHDSKSSDQWTSTLCPKTTDALNTQDNGAFWLLSGPPNDMSSPRETIPFSVEMLDSSRCTRTGFSEFPVHYHHTDGKLYKLHRSRVVFVSQVPTFHYEMFGIGFCALSRMIQTAQHLLDITTSEQEMLGSRPPKQMIVAKSGMTGQEFASAIQSAYEQMDSQGLTRFSKSIVIGQKDLLLDTAPIDIEVIDLTKPLDTSGKESSISIGMYSIALALGVAPRDLWPATTTGATKADAETQHIANFTGGIGYMINLYKDMIGNIAMSPDRYISDDFEIVFDFQDDQQDIISSEINKARSETRKINIDTGVIDIRTAREQMVESGEITEAQFRRMELDDGRQPDNGSDLLTLFVGATNDLLQLSYSDPLNAEGDDRNFVLEMIKTRLIQATVVLNNPTSVTAFENARVAYFALIKLREHLEDKGSVVISTDFVEEV